MVGPCGCPQCPLFGTQSWAIHLQPAARFTRCVGATLELDWGARVEPGLGGLGAAAMGSGSEQNRRRLLQEQAPSHKPGKEAKEAASAPLLPDEARELAAQLADLDLVQPQLVRHVERIPRHVLVLKKRRQVLSSDIFALADLSPCEPARSFKLSLPLLSRSSFPGHQTSASAIKHLCHGRSRHRELTNS